MDRCRERVRLEDVSEKVEAEKEPDAPCEVLGTGFSEECKEILDQKHLIGALDLQPVPLDILQHVDPYKNPEGKCTDATVKAFEPV